MKKRLLLSVLLFAFACHSSADNVSASNAASAGSPASGLTHTGRKPAIIPAPKGFGRDVPVRDAIAQIVPGNFQIYNDRKIPLSHVVSWSGGDADDWSQALDAVLRKANLSATIDWSRVTISIDGQNPPPEKSKPLPEWKLSVTDKTVRGAMLRWARESGWSVDWDVAVDFPIRIETSFRGDFEDVVSEVMSSLSASDYPLQACSYENKTLRVVRYGDTSRCEAIK